VRTPGIRHYLGALVLAAFLPVAGLALALFVLSMRSEYETAWQRVEARTTFIAAAVQTQMDALAGTLDVLSASPALREGDFTAFHAQARVITGERVDAVSLVRPDGTTILNSRVVPGQTPPAFSVPQEDVKRAISEGGIVVGNLFSGATSRRPIFAMLKPVNVAGKPHVLAVGLFASRFEPLIDRTLAPWTAALLDSSAKTAAQFPRTDNAAADHVPAIAENANTSDRGRLTLTRDDGSEHMVVYERIPFSRWIAVAGLPRESVEGPAFRTAGIYGIGAVLLSVPSVLLASWLGLRLARSMKSLAGFATAMGGEVPCGAATPPPLAASCRELDVVAERLKQTACEIAARDTQLRQQRDLAEQNATRIARQSEELTRSNTELEQFAYVASHDLREPLRMVSSFLGLLERHLAGKLDAEGHEFIGYARDGAQRMDQMIMDLLQYSRVGRMETVMEEVDLGRAVETAQQELAPKIAEAGGAITIEGPLPTVAGFPAELARLFQNLLGNAIKYRAPDRAPQVIVRACPVAEGWRITVADNGIGIEPQFFDRIFAIFQRLHTRTQYEGSGIGLAICKKIVEHHHGHIWVESEPGAGSAFHFILPATVAAQAPALSHS
jgi:signal transduction histidine kinase